MEATAQTKQEQKQEKKVQEEQKQEQEKQIPKPNKEIECQLLSGLIDYII